MRHSRLRRRVRIAVPVLVPYSRTVHATCSCTVASYYSCTAIPCWEYSQIRASYYSRTGSIILK
jgi:hypothetical protein